MGITSSKAEQKALPIYLFSLTAATQKDIIHIPSLDVEYFQVDIDFSSYDHLIITSKQAVEALKQYDKKAYSNKKALCISKASAKAYETLGTEVLEVAQGYGDSLVKYIKKYPRSTKWLYLRAEEIASDFCETLKKEGFFIDQKVVYRTKCSLAIQKVTLPQNAILIFTSPSSVRCFLQNHRFNEGYKVIVIGKTTAKLLPKTQQYFLPKEPSIKGCLAIAKEFS